MPGTFERIGRKCRAFFRRRPAATRRAEMEGGAIPENAVPTSSSFANISYFPNAHNLNIPSLNINNIHSTPGISDPSNIVALLEAHVSHGAAHNSDERCDAPKCAPETRRAVQEEIVGWMKDSDTDDKPMNIMWLTGSCWNRQDRCCRLCRRIVQRGEFPGSNLLLFVLLRFAGQAFEALHSHDAGVSPCKAPQLHQFKTELLISIDHDRDIFRKHLKEQAHCLLLKPFRTIQGCRDSASWPKSILIDGLDEVQAVQYNDAAIAELKRVDEDDQLEILEVLHMLASDPAFPFRIFVASHPESVIEEFFSSTAQDMTVRLFLDSKYNPNADIALFLKSKFTAIRRRYGISDASWPGQQAFDRILDMSSGQFLCLQQSFDISAPAFHSGS